jgi:DNA polymerase III epsilon subunit-like protein
VPAWLLEALQLTPQAFAESALHPKIALQKFLAFIGDHDVFIHNALFDLPFIHRFASELGVEFKNTVFDTLQIAELTWPGQRCSIDGLREFLEMRPGETTENAANATLQVLIAAREIAQNYHAQRAEMALTMQSKSSLQVVSTWPAICPFCEIHHNFQD